MGWTRVERGAQPIACVEGGGTPGAAPRPCYFKGVGNRFWRPGVLVGQDSPLRTPVIIVLALQWPSPDTSTSIS